MRRNTYHIGLWNYAREYFNAAQELRGNEEEMASDPVYYLYGHSVELALKAFLVYQGYNERKLREIGHNLVSACTEARHTGLDAYLGDKMKTEAVETIALINPYYNAKELEYIVTGSKRYPHIIHMHNIARNLIYAVGLASGMPEVQLNK